MTRTRPQPAWADPDAPDHPAAPGPCSAFKRYPRRRSRLRLRRAHPADAARIAPSLDRADLEAIEAEFDEPPAQVLRRGIEDSATCYALESDRGSLCALFGIIPEREPSTAGVGWLVVSDKLAAHRMTFLRHCRPWLQGLSRRYSCIWNVADARHEKHLRWLRWCGFRVARNRPAFGREQRLFLEVVYERDRGRQTL